jgi:predicted transcriptional regulator
MFVTAIGAQIEKLVAEGLPVTHIADRLDVAQATVHYYLRKAQGSESGRGSLAPGPRNPARARRAPEPSPRAKQAANTRELVACLFRLGISQSEIAQRLGLAKSTVSYHVRRLSGEVDERFGRRFDWRAVQRYYDEGHSVRDCARVFGFTTWSWSDAVRRGAIRPRPSARPLEEVFARDTRRNRGHLKARLLRAGLKDGRCERCGLAEWLGQPLSLALHHMNGDRNDNRVENLALLCPNCHAQTNTFGGRNGRGRAFDRLTDVIRPSP